MAKTRMVNTRFWNDSFVVELNPLDRYLFLYLLTNEHTNIAGLYELPLKRMANETGIDVEMLPKMIQRLKGKIYYSDGWVGIKNFQKHQSTTSEKVQRGIEIEMDKIPTKIRDKMEKLYGIDRVSRAIIYPNPNPNPNENVDTPTRFNNSFFEGESRYFEVREELVSKLPEAVVDTELKKFVLYWTEPNKSGTRTRWEQQPTFDVKRRITTWFSRIAERHSAINKGRGLA